MNQTRLMKISKYCCILTLYCAMAIPSFVYSKERSHRGIINSLKDSLSKEPNSLSVDSSLIVLAEYDFRGGEDSLRLKEISKLPFVSLQQMLKGRSSGVYVTENNGEPGSASQAIFIRGLTVPVSGNKQILEMQPVVYLNGIPLITDNSFIYNIKKDDITPIGPYTNLLSTIDPDNIKSIVILKGPEAVALLGPRAANGAISITTKNATKGKSAVSVNSYFGMAQKVDVTALNAVSEHKFRQTFYNKYGEKEDFTIYPDYLKDQTNGNYFGPSNWTDLYYRDKAVYSINAGLTGGSDASNFRLFLGNTKNGGVADDTNLDRYNASFFINIAPVKWLTVSSMLNATRLDRDRNRNFRERFSDMQYLPDLTSPISPTKEIYGSFLNEYSRLSFDKNKINSINGYFSFLASLKKWQIQSKISFDYNEGLRDVFWPSTLLDGNSYVSNYFSYNQRLIVENQVSHKISLNSRNKLHLLFGQSFQGDQNKYNYSYGYKGSSDFIRINEVEGNSQDPDYLQAKDYLVFRYTDKQKSNLFSLYGRAQYNYKELIRFSTVLRTDGSSNGQPTDRWFFSPEADVEFNLNKAVFKDKVATINDLKLRASYGRLGSLNANDRVAAGPHYTVDLGWSGSPSFYSYGGFGTLSRPYTTGWVGYDIPWQYNEEFNLGLESELFQNRLRAGITYYHKNTRNAYFEAPVNAETGYLSIHSSGLAVNNQGIELDVFAHISDSKNHAIGWSTSLNITHSSNKLLSLPNGATSLNYGQKNLVVGEPIDQFWVFENRGIFEKDADVPVNPENSEAMTYKGIALKAGDPVWVDQNNDYKIDDHDKVSTKNYMPKYYGSFTHVLNYKRFKLDLNIYFALERSILKQYVANRYDFINRDAQQSINSVKEIFFWRKDFNSADYPVYNPWSPVRPYRSDQDLFLENGAFAKLRSMTLSYEFTPRKRTSGKKMFKNVVVYVTGANLLTITPYSGRDPELIGFTGIDDGYGIEIPKTFVAGFKLDI